MRIAMDPKASSRQAEALLHTHGTSVIDQFHQLDTAGSRIVSRIRVAATRNPCEAVAMVGNVFWPAARMSCGSEIQGIVLNADSVLRTPKVQHLPCLIPAEETGLVFEP